MKKSKIPFGYIKVNDIKRLRFITDILNQYISKKSKILDVGCGNGIISINLGEEGYTVLGIDISSNTTINLQQKGKKVIQGDATDLNFWQRVNLSKKLRLCLRK